MVNPCAWFRVWRITPGCGFTESGNRFYGGHRRGVLVRDRAEYNKGYIPCMCMVNGVDCVCIVTEVSLSLVRNPCFRGSFFSAFRPVVGVAFLAGRQRAKVLSRAQRLPNQ